MKSIIFAVIYCSVVLLNISFGQVTFSKYYTNPLNGLDVSNNLILDDSILIYPFAGLNTFNWQQMVIAKLNSFGDVLVQKEYGDTMEWIVPQASLFLNDNYYVGCYHANAFNSQESIGLMKIDKNLDTIWFKKYAFDTLFEYINQSILLCADGGILISAQKYDKAFTDGNIYLIKVDSNGIYQWDKEFVYPNWDAGWASIELPDHGFFVIGQTRSFGAGQRDWLLIRTDSVGNEKWHKTFGYPEIDTPINISKATDGNYFIAGQMEFNNFSKAAIYKIDTSGNIKWYNHYAITEQTEFWKATELGDGSIIAAGLAEDTSDYIGKGLLMKVDALGNPLWHRIFPVGNNHAWFRNVYPTADGGFIMPGSAVDGPSGNQDAWLVKVDSLGCDSNGCALYTALPSIAPLSNGEGPEVRIFPNPCSNFFLINFTKKQNDYDTYTVTVTNSAGQILLKQKMVNSTQPHPIFVQSLTAGFYMVKVSVGDNVYVRKLIIEK